VARSTSENTEPNADTNTCVPPFDPGRKKVTSVMLLPTAVKSRVGLKARNSPA